MNNRKRLVKRLEYKRKLSGSKNTYKFIDEYLKGYYEEYGHDGDWVKDVQGVNGIFELDVTHDEFDKSELYSSYLTEQGYLLSVRWIEKV